MSGNLRKLNGGAIHRSPYFYVLSAVFTAVVFLTLIGSFREYRTSISFAVIGRSEMVACQSREICANIVEVTRRLAFYNKLVQENPALSDPYANLDPDERKAGWNSGLNIASAGASNVIDVAITRESRGESIAVAMATIRTIFNVISNSYDIEDTVALRIVDGPVTKPVFMHLFWLTCLSAILGSVLAYCITYIFVTVGVARKPRVLLPSAINFDFLKKLKVPGATPVLRESPQQTIDHQEVPPIVVKSAAAPVNLPIGELPMEDFNETAVTSALNDVSMIEDIPELPMEIAEDAPKKKTIYADDELFGIADAMGQSSGNTAVRPKGEPTEEEYKRRLNALLRGEI